MDHYDALLKAVGRREVVQFDRRQRETLDQKDPCAAQERMALLINGLEALSMSSQDGYLVDQVIPAAFQSGLNGEHELLASSTIGRELLFVNHHAVHHLAILRIYCEQAGLVLSPDLGKAPSTIAHERQMLAVCA